MNDTMPPLPEGALASWAPLWMTVHGWRESSPGAPAGKAADAFDAAVTKIAQDYAREYAAGQVREVVEALTALLKRDERNTCQHTETHRAGLIWEICDACGMKWADDRGGKPVWKDPPEWVAARALIDKHKTTTPQTEG